MTDDLPDHTNYSLIKAVDESGNLVTVLADSSGRIVSVMKGDYAGSMKTLAVDSAGRMISVIRDPTNDNYIAVDSNGNIVSVMKGDYAGTMKTLAVDSQGRIQAVLTDPEDVFGNPNYIGAGELAVRLGSIKSYEKRGEVVFMDSFEDATLKWVTGGTGTGHSEARSNESARSGNYSMKLTTGNAQWDASYMYHYAHQPVMKKLGFEYSFALGTGLWFIYNVVYVYDGTYRYYAWFLYSCVDDELRVVDENGVSQVIASSIVLKEHDHLYHSWKQTIDLVTEKYVRCYLDNVEYDVSGYGFQKSANASPPHMRVDVIIYTYADANSYAYIDDCIITQNEP